LSKPDKVLPEFEKRSKIVKNFFLVVAFATCSVFSAPVFTVVPTLGPIVSSSANFDTWAANVIQGLINTSSPGSDVNQFVPLTDGANLLGREFIESASGGFASWQGLANPIGGFAGEFGTALYFALIIKDDQEQGTIRLSELNVNETYLGEAFSNSAIGGNYRSTLWGVDTSNTVLNSGETATTFVKELYYVGVGFTQPLDLSIVGSDQERLNGTMIGIQALNDRTTKVCYDLNESSSGCASVNVAALNSVPEQSTLALISLGLILMAFWRKAMFDRDSAIRTTSLPSEVFDLKPTSVESPDSVESRLWRVFRNF
jgi:hypothetical protein